MVADVNALTRRRLLFLGGFSLYFVALWLLWETPVVYPLKVFVVFLHEISHGIAAVATGGSIQRITLSPRLGGACYCPGGNAFLTLSAFNSFFPTMVQGRGWVCIALVVFASWRPERALLGALLFALFDAYQLRLQPLVKGVPYQLFLMVPYVLSIVALIVMARRARVPRALMQPYRRGER
jgi:simple sugar transport system permease protein